jgi:hypothetical protein
MIDLKEYTNQVSEHRLGALTTHTTGQQSIEVSPVLATTVVLYATYVAALAGYCYAVAGCEGGITPGG